MYGWNVQVVWLGLGLPQVLWLEPRFKFSHDPSPAWHCVSAIEVL